MERGRSVVRLSEYIYLLLHRGRQGEESVENTDSAPASPPASAPTAAAASSLATPPLTPPNKSPSRPGATPGSTAYAKPLLCQPVMLQWRKDVMVHFVVPGQFKITLFFINHPNLLLIKGKKTACGQKTKLSLTHWNKFSCSFTVLAELCAKCSPLTTEFFSYSLY